MDYFIIAFDCKGCGKKLEVHADPRPMYSFGPNLVKCPNCKLEQDDGNGPIHARVLRTIIREV